MTKDEIVGLHHRLSGHESEQTPGEWRTEKPGALQSLGLQTVRRNLAFEQQQQFSQAFEGLSHVKESY